MTIFQNIFNFICNYQFDDLPLIWGGGVFVRVWALMGLKPRNQTLGLDINTPGLEFETVGL